MAESEHNVTININGNANVAVNALNKVRAGLDGVLKYAQMAFGFVSKINWVVGGIQTIVRGITWLKDKLKETERAAAKLRDEMSRTRIEERVKREAASYDKLNKALAETNRLEKERNGTHNATLHIRVGIRLQSSVASIARYIKRPH